MKKQDGRKNNGGRRKGSGRKPLLNKEDLERVQELIGQHGAEVDPNTKQERILSLLDVLYEEGSTNRNIAAIKEYFDRQMGKPKQSVDLTTRQEEISEEEKNRADNALKSFLHDRGANFTG